MTEGWFCCDDYYCSEACLGESMPVDENESGWKCWNEHHYREDGDCYWTEWEEPRYALTTEDEALAVRLSKSVTLPRLFEHRATWAATDNFREIAIANRAIELSEAA